MARKQTTGPKAQKKVTRYTYDEIREPRTPETGHTPLLPAEEQVVTPQMDNGWCCGSLTSPWKDRRIAAVAGGFQGRIY